MIRQTRLAKGRMAAKQDAAPDRDEYTGGLDVWSTLQQSIGNSAIGRMFGGADGGAKNDEPDEKPVDSPAASGAGGAPGASEDKYPQPTEEGQIPAIVDEDPEPKEDTSFGRPRSVAHALSRDVGARHTPTWGGAQAMAAPPAPRRATQQATVVADLTLDSNWDERPSPELDAAEETQKGDAAVSGVYLGNQVAPGGIVKKATAFGEEHVKYNVDNIKVIRIPSKVPAATVSARIYLDIDWGTQDRGRTNIASENDPAVTKDTYQAIVNDITPSATGRVTRATYWCKDITEKHEKFHATDDIDRATLYLPTAKAFIEGKTFSDVSNQATSDAEAAAVVPGPAIGLDVVL
jgi:hypothetical protein